MVTATVGVAHERHYLWVCYLAHLLTQLPMDAAIPCVFSSIACWLVGLNLAAFTVVLSAVEVTFMFGACAPNIDAGSAMT